MDEILIGLASFALGIWTGRQWFRRLKKLAKPEDRDGGLARYQAYKDGR